MSENQSGTAGIKRKYLKVEDKVAALDCLNSGESIAKFAMEMSLKESTLRS